MPKPKRDISSDAGSHTIGGLAVRVVFPSAAAMLGQEVIVTACSNSP